MATITTNYGWTKPDYEDDADIMVINDTIDNIDAQVKTNENNISSISIIEKTSFENSGRLDTTGTFLVDSNWRTTNYIDITYTDSIEFQLYQLSSSLSMIAFYNESYTFISSVTNVGTDRTVVHGEISPPAGAKYMCASLRVASEGQYIKYKAVTAERIERISNKQDYFLKDNLAKPFNFANANIIGFGDSIMYGYRSIDPSDVSPNPWYSIFKDRTGATNFTCRAVGGATYSSSNSILAQLNGQILNTRDFIFVAAGTNDYNSAYSMTIFANAIENTFDYIDANKGTNTKVIIITPINRTANAANGNPIPLDWYRECITEKALLHGYSVVDGSKMSFTKQAGAYQQATMADGVHPTDLGYQIYANYLLGLLL